MTRATEVIEFSRSPDLHGVEVLLAEHSSRRWRWFHETYTLCTILGGDCPVEWAYRGKIHVAAPGEVMLYEPGEVHRNTNVPQDISFRVLFISPSVLAEAAAELGLPLTFHWKMTHTPAATVQVALVGLHAALESAAPRLEVQSQFAGCVRRVLEICAETGGKVPRASGGEDVRLRRVRDFIHENYHRSISLEELSRIAGVSRFYLSRAFASRYGLPPHAYQIDLRVAKARRLLATGARPTNIASELGFSDQSHFNRHFQRVAQKTPGAYARMVLNPLHRSSASAIAGPSSAQ